MPVEFIGVVQSARISPIHNPPSQVDPDFVIASSKAHERAGFDKVLIGYGSTKPDPFQVAALGAAHTERLGFLIAHRPGFVAPTLASRQLATLDQMSRGRLSVNVVTGGSDADQRAEGDYLTKDDRYGRTDEYIDILKAIWATDEPVSHDGPHYRFDGYRGITPCYQQPHIPIYMSGSSAAANRVVGKHADLVMYPGEPLAGIAENIANVQAEAAKWGTQPRFSASFFPVLGATEDQAWKRAHELLALTEAAMSGDGGWLGKLRGAGNLKKRPEGEAFERALRASEAAEIHDRALWTGFRRVIGGFGSHTPLVGTPETVAEALLDYYDIGLRGFQIFGNDGSVDSLEYGQELIPLVREKVAAREAELVAAPAGIGTGAHR
jgi:alkanesulfonate monooxygenase